MPVTTVEAFLRVVTKSRLLSTKQVEAIAEEFAGENDPKAVARKLVKDDAINKWQALQLLAGRSALMMGKYKLLDQLEADDVRRTYLAEHAQMGRRVAVTTLSSKYTKDNPEAVKHFLDQARKLAALDHRNIVHAYDVDSQDDRYYVVMEHIDGRNLQEVLDDRGALPLELATRYVSQCAAGLAYAHEQKHIHGAICPANLLIDSQDDIKIANLGTTALVVSKHGNTPAASVDYISPEQAAGESSPDARSDIYSLGCVLYALLTGHPPFAKGSDDERRRMHQTEQPPAVLDDRPDAPEELVAIYEKMMAKKPSDRFSTAGEICERLEGGSEEKSEAEPVVVSSETDGSDSSDIAESKPAPPKAAGAPPRAKPQEKAQSDKKPGEAADKKTPQAPEARQAKPKPKTDQSAKSPPPKKPAAEKRKPPSKQPSADKSTPAPKQEKPPAPSPKQQIAADAPAKSPKAPAPAAKGKKPAKPSGKKAGEESKAKPGAAAAGGVAVDTKRRRRRKKAGIPTIAYIIGGAAGGLVLLTGAILLVVFLFSGGEEVAAVDGEQATAETAEGTEEAASEDAEDDPAIDEEMDPEMDPVFEEEADPVPESDAVAMSDTTTGDSETEPSQDASTTDGGSDTATSKPADAPKPAAGAAKKENAAKTKPDSTGGTDSTPKEKSEEKPSAKKSAEKKPAKKKPPAKKSPAKPAKKPFQDIQKLVSLPDVNATEPKGIGSIHVPSGELCFIKLRGGEKASKGSQIFAMRNADGGLAERDWEVFLREGESGPDTKIAHLSLNDASKLSFQWQPEAQSQEVASHLTNCALSLSCSGESHVALLRKPTQVEPAALDLEKPSMKQDWDIGMLPDPSAVFVEITGVKGAKYTVEPTPRLDADKGEVWVKIEDGGGLLSLKVETSLKKKLQITVTPHIKLSADTKPEKLNVRKLQQYTKTAQTATQQGQMMLNQLNQMMKAKRMPEDQKRRTFGPRLALYESQLKKAQTALESCQKLDRMLKDVKLTMNFRVLYDADSSEVDLLKIGS